MIPIAIKLDSIPLYKPEKPSAEMIRLRIPTVDS